MRNLASIQTIGNIHSLPMFNNLELATVLGWQVLVKKGEYKVGDKTIYVEIDSLMPEKPEFEFLRSKHFKIKSMKMRGVISQGICFPLSILPEGEYIEGQDVTDIIGVTQFNKEKEVEEYEPVVKKNKNPVFDFFCKFKLFRKLFLKKKEKTAFPDWIQKTDETRYQNMPFLKELGKRFETTEKLEGTSTTFGLKIKKGFWKDKNEFAVCSRNRKILKNKYTKQTNTQFSNSVYMNMFEKYNIEKVLLDLKDLYNVEDSIIIQGETIGPNIQNNIYELKEHEFYVYNLIIDGKTYSSSTNSNIVKMCNLKHVPVVHKDIECPEDMEKFVTGPSILNQKTLREGLVFRDYIPDHTQVDWKGLFSFKGVSNEYLLKSKLD